MTTLELKCLGGLAFKEDGIPITELKSRKGQALLCYLAVSRKRFTRSALAGMFWMDMPESLALMNLRKVVHRMKSLSAYLVISRETLAFNQAAPYWLDVREFENAAAAGSNIQRLEYAVSLYEGDFLDGFDNDRIPLFAQWVRAERTRLGALAVDSIQALIGYYTSQQNYPEAIHFTRRLLTIETWSEEAHRELMRLLSLSGHRSEAIKQYELCCQALKEELGVEPASSTVLLYRQIAAGDQIGNAAEII